MDPEVVNCILRRFCIVKSDNRGSVKNTVYNSIFGAIPKEEL